MTPTLSARHAPRYATLGRLLLEHRGAFGSPGPASEGGSGADEAALEEKAAALVDELESLGPTFVKLGQLLSTRADLLPEPYLEALSRLRDGVEPLPAGQAEKIIEQELGFRISKGFASFDPKPMGSASLGQVHGATMRQGRPVAVKVQRPGVEQQVAEDMKMIVELADWLEAHSATAKRIGFVAMVEEFERTITAEIDYTAEASNLRLLHEQLSRYRHLVIPLPVADYSTRRVLTMDLVEGRSISSLGPLARLDLDCHSLASELFDAYLDQMLVNGFIHADPHPGNVLLTTDGRLALIDAGMVTRLGPSIREDLLRLLVAVSSGNGTEAAAALAAMGDPLDDFDREGLEARVSEVVLVASGATIAELDVGRLLGSLARAAIANGLRPPVELALLTRALLSLDAVARVIDPGFDPSAAVRRRAAHLMRHRMFEEMSPAHMLTAALDAKEFVERFPSRMNKVLDALAEGKFTLNVEGVDEADLMRVGQKLANRLATGVVVAALLLAAGLFSRAGGGTRVWGYPVLTVCLLGVAIFGTIWLLLGIVRSDLPQRRRRNR